MDGIATFSIVGRDPESGELGVAVQSKFLGAGSVVSWAKAGVGAIATQAAANLDYGEIGLFLLAKGYSAEKVLKALLVMDDGREGRQIGIVDARGGSVTFTGKDCFNWAGGDRRGRQSAGLLVVKEGKLIHLLDLHELYFGKTAPGEALEATGPALEQLQAALKKLGYYDGSSSGAFDEETRAAFEAFSSIENFEKRLLQGGQVDKRVLDFLLEKAGLPR